MYKNMPKNTIFLLFLPKPFDLFQDGGPVRHVVEPEHSFLPVSQLFQPAGLLPTLHSPPVLLPMFLSKDGNIHGRRNL